MHFFCTERTDASKTGVAQETVQNMVHKSSKAMTLHEARQVLGVTENIPWEDVLKVKIQSHTSVMPQHCDILGLCHSPVGFCNLSQGCY